MVAKRKTVSKLASALKVTNTVEKGSIEEDEDMEAQIVPVAEENKELSERELGEARSKELKSMGAADLKALLLSHGLETGTKEVMIKSLLKHEAKVRAAAREQKAKIRGVVVKKKQELEGLSTSELSKLCDSAGIKGLRSKEERVQRLLVQWQERDGVDKALADIAQSERKQELGSMDDSKLQKLCTKIGVDPYVKEIMVERINKEEYNAGRFARPSLAQEDEAPKEECKGDMVDALLAQEAQRKREREIKSLQEDAAAQKRKDLKSMSIEDLKKRLAKKGLEASGKKEDMVETLFTVALQEDAKNARQTELKSKSQQELKELLTRQGLETGTKEQMIKTMLAHEAKVQEELRNFEGKIGEAATQKKQELESKSNATLKEMCAAKGLPVGGGKDDRIDRLVDEIQKDGELDKVVSKNLRQARYQELMSMEKSNVVKLCEKSGVDPLVKDIMVERIIAQESEGGAVIAVPDAEPPAKRARTSKK